MIHSQIETLTYPDGAIQRVQLVRFEDWSQLDFLSLPHSPEALDCFADIYRKYLVPACPWLFGNMVLFRLPEGVEMPFPYEGKYGALADPLTAAAAALEAGVRMVRGKPVFRDGKTAIFWRRLEAENCLRVVRGKLPITTVIPVGNAPGYLSRTLPEAAVKVNASFFVMDRFDCATVYDHVGTVFGLCVKDGVVTSPPLYHREALLVRTDGRVTVRPLDVRDLTIRIGGNVYRHGENAAICTRPEQIRTHGPGKHLVIVGCRVVAVCRGGGKIPASGFVLRVEETCPVSPGDPVSYEGLEDVRFGIQVGNSIVIDGKKTDRFRSRFYNIRHLEPVPYPPSLYPMNYRKSRAARIALGADAGGKPMLLWAEGAGKLRYVPGEDSRGASLGDMADICCGLGMVNGVNLDGGGSAQILLGNCRSLKISDRNPGDNSDAERPVPLGLAVRE